ncbi:glycosyltransferase family 4 protein [Candidatus Poribacteria bacterium]|jgi:glycosyltransferase involved in cell wall biosynthesis|nr:glycosyltransferase family 4 protein [Candidatus Poribacteria bacterium]MBT5532708.1 glycosyltransferase family 4 protein [Candidatus Poribacteria bacterium]MBT5714723.1 glycosyltransferase family 4 protein [Candidatus Poribacteria bacterium]MBT7099303.1 glycosyltransferase family 4 protein [Candidatus Poribacteria bacterium]MBT7809172.1 glycosyltransferase family 4 protein [Candidatus Poribacteria bacterium]
MHVILVSGPNRAHKLLVLLDGFEITHVRGLGDVRRLRGLARQRSVVVVDSLGRVALLGFLSCLVSWSPLVFRVRGSFFQEEREMLRARKGVLRWAQYLANTAIGAICLRVARGVLYNSQYAEDMLGSHDRVAHRAIVHNPYTALTGKDGPAVEAPAEGLHILTATNMNARSKMETLHEAISDWIPKSFWADTAATWLICGGGLHEARLRGLVADLGLEDSIRVLGQVDYLPALYEWCDVFAHLTYLDTFPNTVMEAMMSAKPVVTNTRSCGTREQVLHGVTGLVFEEGPAVVDAFEAYRADPEMGRQHGQAGLARVEEMFSVAAQARRLRDALDVMCG